MFKIGDLWYLLHYYDYYISQNARGPYRRPPGNFTIDYPEVRVGKRMFDGKRHIYSGFISLVIGENPPLSGHHGGAQSCMREIYPGPGGRLYCKPAEEVVNFFSEKHFEYKSKSNPLPTRIDVPNNYMLECTAMMSPDAKLDIVLRAQEDLTDGYHLQIEPSRQMISFRGTGRPIERGGCPIDTSKPVKVQVFVQGSIIECFVNDAYAVTRRVDEHLDGDLALRVLGGKVEIETLVIRTEKLQEEENAE